MHAFDNAFDKTPFADQVHGIFGCVPAEMLHVTGNGIMKYQLEIVKQIIESGTKTTKRLHQLDVLHHNLVTESLKQSERDMPRMSSRNGVTDGTKMTASERVGNMFILLCVSHTKDGRGILNSGLNELGIALSAFKNCLKLQLSFEKWVDDSNPIIDVCGASELLSKLIKSIKKCFPRIDGNGWNIPKMHSLAKMLHYMQQFGSANNFSGQIGERALKSMVKDHAQQTQRRVNVFASQCADREYESKVYNHAYNDVKHLLCAEKKNEANVDTISPFYRGRHIVTFAHGNVFGGDTVTVQWTDKTKEKFSMAINDTFKFAVKSYACSHKYYDSFQVNAYTSARLRLKEYVAPVLFHANNYLYGSERYHFCMVQFADTSSQGIDTFSTCPAQIVGFFKYESRGLPTPELIDNNLSLMDIKDQNMIDDTMYAVVHTATSYVSWIELERSFVMPFTLGHPKECVYVVSIENITDPMYVFKDYGNDGLNFFCTLPYKRWGAYFRNRIYV